MASNVHWIREDQSPKTIVRREGNMNKFFFSISLKSNGWLWIQAADSGDTVDGDYYIDNCLESVIEELKDQRPKSGLKGIKLLHENTKPQVAKEAKTF